MKNGKETLDSLHQHERKFNICDHIIFDIFSGFLYNCF